MIFFSISQQLPGSDRPLLFHTTTALARGGTGLLKADGLDAFFYNPAKLHNKASFVDEVQVLSPQISVGTIGDELFAKRDELSELDTSPKGIIEQWGDENIYLESHLLLGASFNSLSFAVYNINYVDIFLSIEDISSLDISTEDTIYNNVFSQSGLFIGRAFKLRPELKLGFAAKMQHKSEFVAEKIAEDLIETIKQDKKDRKKKKLAEYYNKNSGYALGMDIGASLETRGKLRPRFALVIKDIFTTTYKKDKDSVAAPSSEPQYINLASDITYQLKNGRYAFSLGAEVLDILNKSKQSFLKKINLGFEAKYLGAHSLLAGLYNGYPSFGIKVKTRLASAELAVYTKETAKILGLGGAQRKSFRLKLGWLL